MASLICRIHGREALPVRAIPYVGGSFFYPPRELVRNLARQCKDPNLAILQNLSAFHISDGVVVPVQEEEWDEFAIKLDALESRLNRVHPTIEEASAVWLDEATSVLPAGVFVWRDEFEKNYQDDLRRTPPELKRKSDATLNFSPILTAEQCSMIGEEAPRVISSPIDWEYQRLRGFVPAWEAVALSCDINPEDEKLDVDDLLATHKEVRRRLHLLRKSVGSSDFLNLVTLDGRDTAVRLEEFAAWWIDTQNVADIPNQLAMLGQPLWDERNWPAATAEFIEKTYNGHIINWLHWVHDLDKLTAAEAACLMCALDPDVFRNLDEQPDDNESIKNKKREAREIQRTAERKGMDKASPKKWLNWADDNGLMIHPGFRIAVNEADALHEHRGQNREHTGPVVTASQNEESVASSNWIMLVQTEAARRFQALRAGGASPNKHSIKDDLAKWCIETNVKSSGGIHPSGPYIYRHALRKWKPPD